MPGEAANTLRATIGAAPQRCERTPCFTVSSGVRGSDSTVKFAAARAEQGPTVWTGE